MASKARAQAVAPAARAGAGKQDEEKTAEWLEGELREARSRLHKVEAELAQALKHFWTLEADVKKMREALAVSAGVTGLLQGLRDDVRQLRDQLGTVQDRQVALGDRMEAVDRQRKADSGRDGPEIGALSKQLDVVGRTVEQFEGRAKALDEAARHLEEEVAGTRLEVQTLERTVADVSSRVARTHEAAMRLEQQAAGAANEIQGLRNEDEASADKLRLVNEQLRRTAERLDKLESLAEFPEQVRELLQAASFEREQLSQRLMGVERLATEVHDHMQEFVQGMARVDQRSQQQAGDLLALTREVQVLNEQTSAALKKVYQVLLRQRKRQAEALAQEVKELAQGELHTKD